MTDSLYGVNVIPLSNTPVIAKPLFNSLEEAALGSSYAQIIEG